MAEDQVDHSMRDFANDLISEQFRFYADTQLFPFPLSVDPATLHNRYNLSSEQNLPIAQYLQFLGGTLRQDFAPAFERAFPFAVRDELNFFKYCLAFSDEVKFNFGFYGVFLKPDHHLKWPFLYFLVSCAFIAEFALYCFQRRCYRFACSAKNCVLAVHFRHFREHLFFSSDRELMSKICSDLMGIMGRLPPMAPKDAFVKVFLDGNTDTYESMVERPVTVFMDTDINTILKSPLLNVEDNYVIGGYMPKDERDSTLATCDFCGYACIIHLKMLLLFEFAAHESRPRESQWRNFIPTPPRQ